MSEREYVRKPERVKAVEWRKPGDHPAVEQVSDAWDHQHWYEIKGRPVKPGDWILMRDDGAVCVMDDIDFRHAYSLAPPIDVRSQVLALAELKDGWLDGEGKAYDPAALARVAAIAERLAAIAAGRVYPSPDGKVVLEWGGRPHDDSLEIDPATGRMEFHLFDLDTHKAIVGVVAPEEDA